jgi:hypothetical protein
MSEILRNRSLNGNRHSCSGFAVDLERVLFSEIPGWDLSVERPQTDVSIVGVCGGFDVERFVGVAQRTEISGVKPRGADVDLIDRA